MLPEVARNDAERAVVPTPEGGELGEGAAVMAVRRDGAQRDGERAGERFRPGIAPVQPNGGRFAQPCWTL